MIAAVLVAGCAGPSATPTTPAPVASGSNPNNPARIAARQAAGLPDCTVPAAAPSVVDGGLPDVTLPCLGSDKAVRLASLRGRPMVVNVWAQWCEPCKKEAPILADFAKRSAGKVDLVGIDEDDPKPDDAIAFAAASGWDYPHLVDSDRLLGPRMQIVGIPVTLLVDADGRVVYRKTGPLTSSDELASLVDQYLKVAV